MVNKIVDLIETEGERVTAEARLINPHLLIPHSRDRERDHQPKKEVPYLASKTLFSPLHLSVLSETLIMTEKEVQAAHHPRILEEVAVAPQVATEMSIITQEALIKAVVVAVVVILLHLVVVTKSD